MPRMVLMPARDAPVFMCPRCGVVAAQEWFTVGYTSTDGQVRYFWGEAKDYLAVNKCKNCSQMSFWMGTRLVWPEVSSAPSANMDMPETVARFYAEAAATLPHSPRASAALLRLAMETLLNELGESGSLNTMIGSLVTKGVPEPIQQAMDAVRVHGGLAVHEAGDIVLEDDIDTAISLFKLVNWVVQDRITTLRETAEVFDALPPSKKAAIADRDSTGTR